MKKIILSTACALLLTTGVAAAQSSQGKGGAAMTGETADQSKTPGGMSKDTMRKDTTGQNTMKKDTTGTSGMAKDRMGGANKNGDGQMTKGGMNK